MSLGNVNAKLALEKAVQEYYRLECKRKINERTVVRRIAAFDMRFNDEMTVREIADELGISYSAVIFDLRKVVGFLNWYMRKFMKIESVSEAFA